MSKNNNTSNFFDAIKNIRSDIVLPKPELPNLEVDTTELEQKWAEEAEIRKLQLEALRQQIGTSSGVIAYNQAKSLIMFLGKEIKIQPNTTYEVVCKILFKNKQSMRKVWSWDEIVDIMGDKGSRKQRSIYDATRYINLKIGMETTIKDVLLVTTKTIQLNPQYISK